jgi:hypothetical protein
MSNFGDIDNTVVNFGQSSSKECKCFVESELTIGLAKKEKFATFGSKDLQGFVEHKKKVLCIKCDGAGGEAIPGGGKGGMGGGRKCPTDSFEILPALGSPTGDNVYIRSVIYLDCGECVEKMGDPTSPSRKCGDEKKLCEVYVTLKELQKEASKGGAHSFNNASLNIMNDLWDIWNTHKKASGGTMGVVAAEAAIKNKCNFIRGLLRHGVGKPKKYCGYYRRGLGVGGQGKDDPECKTPLGNPGTGHGAIVEKFCNNKKDKNN